MTSKKIAHYTSVSCLIGASVCVLCLCVLYPAKEGGLLGGPRPYEVKYVCGSIWIDWDVREEPMASL